MYLSEENEGEYEKIQVDAREWEWIEENEGDYERIRENKSEQENEVVSYSYSISFSHILPYFLLFTLILSYSRSYSRNLPHSRVFFLLLSYFLLFSCILPRSVLFTPILIDLRKYSETNSRFFWVIGNIPNKLPIILVI